MVGVCRRERKNGDCCKTMFRAIVGGEEGARGVRNQRGQACLWSCCGCWINGTYNRLSVVGRGEGEMPPTLMLCWERQMLGTVAVLPPPHDHDQWHRRGVSGHHYLACQG